MGVNGIRQVSKLLKSMDSIGLKYINREEFKNSLIESGVFLDDEM